MDQPQLPPIITDRVNAISSVLLKENPTDTELAAAAGFCEELVRIDRGNPLALFLFATVYMKAKQPGIAEALFRYVLHLNPEQAEAANNLGSLLQMQSRTDEARALFIRTLELQPGNLEALGNLVTTYINNGTPDEAIKYADQLLADHPDNADAIWNRSLAYLEAGRWDEGWAGYRQGLHMRGTASGLRKNRFPDLEYWDGKPGKQVLIYGEQGVGDEILGMSMVNEALDVLEDNAVLECHPRLVSIARRAFGHRIPVYGTRKVDEPTLVWPNWHNIEARIPILGLGEYFRAGSTADWPMRNPFFHPDVYGAKGFVTRWGRGKPAIGVSWSGGTLPTRADLRSVPLGRFIPLMKELGDSVHWISLQYDPPDKPGFYAPIVEGFRKDTGINLIHDTEAINDLDTGYAQMLPACDMVLTVCTSVVHACGAYGVPCLVLTPYRPAWRYQLTGDEMPWYGPHVRMLRQGADEDWTPVFDSARQHTLDFLGAKEC